MQVYQPVLFFTKYLVEKGDFLDIFKHNDYEILFLIREGNEEALSLMFEKYTPLIYKKIGKFNLGYEADDMFQEGLMMLYKSIRFFEEKYDKTFTRYFEQNLERRFISITTMKYRRSNIFRKNEHYIYETNSAKVSNSVYYELMLDEIAKVLTKKENLVYTLRELNNFSISYIKKNYGIQEKTIYNSLHRAKVKIANHFNN